MPDPSTVDGLTQSGTIIAWERQFGWRQRRVAKVFHSRGQRNLTTCQGSNQCWLGTRRASPVLLQLPAMLYSISLPLTLPLPSLSVFLCRCLRAFCSWLVVCALLCHCICVSLGYAKSIKRHNRISYGGTPHPPSPSASLTHLQSQSPSHSLFHSHSPFPSRSHFQFPLSWSFSIWYARPIFAHLKRVFVFVIVFFSLSVCVCLYLYLSCFVVVVVVIVVLARCACRRQFIAFLLWFCVNFFGQQPRLGATRISPVQACFACLSC